MRDALILALSICFLGLARPGAAAERVLLEWDFTKAADALGWQAAEPIAELTVSGGALNVVAGPGRPKLESPLFEIEAKPWQFVEIELSTDADGTGLVYYSNTTEEPYHGFREGQFVEFAARGDGGFHTVAVMPFWQKFGKMTHIRVDPPGDKIAIKAIRIISARSPEPSSATCWDFKGTDAGWAPWTSGAAISATAGGMVVNGGRDVTVFSPALALDCDDYLAATVRIASKTAQTALFRWATDEAVGLQTAPIELRGDGRTHSYTIDLAEADGWTGKVMALGLTPTNTAEPGTITAESIALGDKPIGPPEIEITRFGLADPFVRAGQKARLVVEVTNTGGAEARSVGALVTVSGESLSRTLPVKRAVKLAAGGTATLEWDIDLPNPGPASATTRVTGQGLDAGQRSVQFIVYPALDQSKVAGLKYVPEPVPARSDYLVGCYNFPGWRTYDRWAVLDRFPERRPILGYYREGDPEIADWHINWALSHGIGFFIYDWYWERGQRQLEHGLHDAFLKSRYRDRMKFCLLWANHNAPKTSSEEDLVNVTRYWIENYFRLPNYLKIDGKNVMVIFSTQRLTDDMGIDAVKAGFDKIRKLCEDAGVGGLYLVACTYPGKDRIDVLVKEGYDALSGYNYPAAGNRNQMIAPYEWMVEGYKDYWNQIADAAPTVPYIPVCEPGWDARPWHGDKTLVRTGKSPALWQQMLENAKAFVDDPNRKHPPGEKMVFLEAWNEFGEGDYIEPHAQFGFGYVEAVREVFAPASAEPLVVVPKDIGMGPYELAKPEPRAAWDFAKPEDRTWYVGNMANLSYEGGVMRAEATNADPALYSPRVAIDATKLKRLEIKIRMDKGDEAQLFFTGHHRAMTEEKSVRFKVTPDNEFHVYELDLSANPRWRGTIAQLRLDPNSAAGSKVKLAFVRAR